MKRIVLIGPESTGKSTLCSALATHFDTACCPEYAREYLEQRGGTYTYEDMEAIARGQLRLEAETAAKARHGIHILDTDMTVMKIWYEVVFGTCPLWVLQEVARRPADLYLLCAPDLPWEADGLREYPDPAQRQALYKMYLDLMVQNYTSWGIIEGTEDARLHRAIALINDLCGQP